MLYTLHYTLYYILYYPHHGMNGHHTMWLVGDYILCTTYYMPCTIRYMICVIYYIPPTMYYIIYAIINSVLSTPQGKGTPYGWRGVYVTYYSTEPCLLYTTYYILYTMSQMVVCYIPYTIYYILHTIYYNI